MDTNELFELLSRNDIEQMTQALKSGDVHAKILDETLLMRAAFYGYASMAQLLIDHGLDPNETNNDGEAALFYILNSANAKRDPSKYMDVLKVLLDNNADPYVCDEFGIPFITMLPRLFKAEDLLTLQQWGLDFVSNYDKSNVPQEKRSTSFMHILASVKNDPSDHLYQLIKNIVDQGFDMTFTNFRALSVWEVAHRDKNHAVLNVLNDLGCVPSEYSIPLFERVCDRYISVDQWQENVLHMKKSDICTIEKAISIRLSGNPQHQDDTRTQLKRVHEVFRQRVLELSLNDAVQPSLDNAQHISKKKM